MLTLLSGFDDNTVAVRASGVISGDDYDAGGRVQTQGTCAH